MNSWVLLLSNYERSEHFMHTIYTLTELRSYDDSPPLTSLLDIFPSNEWQNIMLSEFSRIASNPHGIV